MPMEQRMVPQYMMMPIPAMMTLGTVGLKQPWYFNKSQHKAEMGDLVVRLKPTPLLFVDGY